MKIGEEGWQAEVAVGVRALLRNATWVKQAYCFHDEGAPGACYCLLGAVIHVMNPEIELSEQDRPPMSVENRAADFIVAAVPRFAAEREDLAQVIIDWNDNRTRTWDEVDAVVDQLVAHYAMEGRA